MPAAFDVSGQILSVKNNFYGMIGYSEAGLRLDITPPWSGRQSQAFYRGIRRKLELRSVWRGDVCPRL
jgi:hypothetical protein